MVKRSVLGRGLGALIDDAGLVKEQISGIADIELSKIEANPYQPRSNFDQEKLEELAASIREIGLIQPITLRKTGEDRFQIITGERRFRAAQLAGLLKIPAFIRHAEDDSMLEMALVENIQREDLNPIEISLSYQRLIEECNLTQEILSSRIGKNRSTIANYLRLLKLPPEIQKGLKEKQITVGHAKALISVEDQETRLLLFKQILRYDFSVRKVEELVRQLTDQNYPKGKNQQKNQERFRPIKDHLSSVLGFPVKLTSDEEGTGKIIIPFRSEDDLLRIVKILEKGNEN
jgi:ParB family chromosome partitioning protein